MKVLVIFGVIATALAAPLPEADADADRVVVAHHAALTPFAHAPISYTAHGAVAPVASFAHAGLAPLAHAAIAPVAHAAVAPAAVSYTAAAPAAVSYAAAAPAAVSYAAAPVAVTHSVATPVALPPAEVKVPVTTHHVEVPVHQKVHYGTQAYVAGATTTIHKPSLAAPAIAPPSTLLAKVHHNAPEVTLKTQEIPVERHTPNFVDTPYHAGTIVKYTEPEIKEVKVPTPVAQPVPVPHPVPYAAPYAVAQPVAVPHEVHSVAVHQPINYVQHAIPAAAAVVKADY